MDNPRFLANVFVREDKINCIIGPNLGQRFMRNVFVIIRMCVYELQISLYDSDNNASSRGRKIELSYDI